MRVKAKTDIWVSIIIWLVVLIMAGTAAIIPQNEKMLGYAVGLPMTCLILWIYFGAYYEFRDEYLYCRNGGGINCLMLTSYNSGKMMQLPIEIIVLAGKLYRLLSG